MTVVIERTTHGERQFAIAFAAAQMHVRAALQRDWSLEYQLKQADERLQAAFEVLPAELQQMILEVHATLKTDKPNEPPKRKVGPND
jgi:hypothetical protein